MIIKAAETQHASIASWEILNDKCQLLIASIRGQIFNLFKVGLRRHTSASQLRSHFTIRRELYHNQVLGCRANRYLPSCGHKQVNYCRDAKPHFKISATLGKR